MGGLAYSLQIYFDFAGYSTMAIGLGKMMGFNFPVNFNQPYRAENITEFWRRWHITLSRWFRDYLYIPLGGNRVGQFKTLFNLLLVFFLCGLWHGASYTFILWGLYHGTLLIIERILALKFGYKTSGIIGRVLTFILVLIGWIIFRSLSSENALSYIQIMFNGDLGSNWNNFYYNIIGPDKLFYIFMGLFFAFYPFEKNKDYYLFPQQKYFITASISILVLIISFSFIASNGFNPFIYFRF